MRDSESEKNKENVWRERERRTKLKKREKRR